MCVGEVECKVTPSVEGRGNEERMGREKGRVVAWQPSNDVEKEGIKRKRA